MKYHYIFCRNWFGTDVVILIPAKSKKRAKWILYFITNSIFEVLFGFEYIAKGDLENSVVVDE